MPINYKYVELLENFDNLLVFISHDTEIIDQSIIKFLPSDSFIDTESITSRRLLKNNLNSFLDELEKIVSDSIFSCIIITPVNIILLDRSDMTWNEKILDEYVFHDPFIVKLRLEIDISQTEQYQKFICSNPIIKGIIPENIYIVFQSFFEDPGFQLFLNIEKKQSVDKHIQSLTPYLESIHPVYHPDLLYYRIQTDVSYEEQPVEIFELLDKSYTDKEKAFMFYMNHTFNTVSSSNLSFHHIPNLLNQLVFYHYASQSSIDMENSLRFLSSAVTQELSNPYPSLNLVNYLNSISNILRQDDTRPIEIRQHVFLSFATLLKYFAKIAGDYQITTMSEEFVRRVLAITNNTFKEWNKNPDPPGIFKKLVTPEKFNFILTTTERYRKGQNFDIGTEYLLFHTIYSVKIDPHKGSYQSLRELKNHIIKENFHFSISFSKLAYSFLEVIFLTKIYVEYFRKTEYDPDDIISNSSFSTIILTKRKKLTTKLSLSHYQGISKIVPRFEIFPEIVKITTLIFSDHNPSVILNQLSSFLNRSEKKDKILRVIGGRILVFIAKNLHDFTPENILDFLDLIDFKNYQYLNPDILIDHLLRHLLGDRDLSDNDLTYLRKYLDIDTDDLDDTSHDSIADLIFAISTMEDAPNVKVRNVNGTILELQSGQSTKETKAESPDDEPDPLPYIPPTVFDLFDNEDDLMTYLRLFYWYQRVKQQLDRDASNVEDLHYDLLETKPEQELLDRYFPDMTKLKKTDRQTVDDIEIELLNCYLLVREFPTFAISSLDAIEEVLQGRDAPLSDWKRLEKLRLEVLMKLNMGEAIPDVQTRLSLLELYPGKIKIPKYLDLVKVIDHELFQVMDEYSSVEDLIRGIIAHDRKELDEFVTRDLDPAIELLAMLHLSWENEEELQYLLQKYQQLKPDLVSVLASRSDVWNGGFVVGLPSLRIRLAELLSEVDSIIEYTDPDVSMREDDRIHALLVTCEYFADHGDRKSSTSLLDYTLDQMILTDTSQINLTMAIELTHRINSDHLKEVLLRYCQSNEKKDTLGLLKKMSKNDLKGVKQVQDLSGKWPSIEKIVEKFGEENNVFDLLSDG